MKYALIDTNIWTKILEQNDKQILDVLERLIGLGALQILRPNLIVTEWNNNYLSYYPQKKDNPHFTDSAHLDGAFVDKAVQSADNIRMRIENLFESAISVPESDEVKIQAIDRSRIKLAPFHKNSSSHNDCIIYFSTIDWCTINGIDTFLFVTNNYKDFSDPHDRNVLHPELVISNVATQYFTGLRQAMKTVDERCFDGDKQLTSPYSPIIISTLVDAKKEIIEVWENAHEYYFSNLTYIPRNLLCRLYPYVSQNGEPIGYSSLWMYINNPALITLLQGIKILDGVVYPFDDETKSISTEPAERIQSLFVRLNQSQITQLEVHSPAKTIDCFVEQNQICDCIRCSFKRLNFLKVIERLQPLPGDDIIENMREGFVRYLLQDYLLSARFFHRAYQQADEKKCFVSKLIAAQNLQACANHIKGGYVDLNAEKEFSRLHFEEADTVFSGNLQRDKFICEASKNVYRNYFSLNSIRRIKEIHDKISEHYKNQLNGGFSSNNFLNSLIVTFNELRNFVEINAIVSDEATEGLKDIYELVVDAFLMSHNFNELQSSRISAFDDVLLIEIAYYCRPETLRSVLAKYKPATLRYCYPETKVSQFANLAKGLLKDFSRLASHRNAEAEYHMMGSFAGKVCSYLSNVLLLCSYVSFSDNDEAEIAEQYVKLIEEQSDDSVFYREVKGGLAILWRKWRIFNDELLTRLVVALTNGEILRRRDWVDSIGELLFTKKSTLLADNKAMSEKIHCSLTDSALKKRFSDTPSYIVKWFGLLHSVHQIQITEWVSNELRKNFQPDLFYQFAIYEVCDYAEFYEEFISTISPPTLDLQEHRLPMTRFATSHRLGDLINLAYKFNLPMKGVEFEKFQGCSPYYDWLLDLDGYDYSNFNEEWVLEYQTFYYLNKIFSNRTANTAIKQRLKARPNIVLAEMYFRYSN